VYMFVYILVLAFACVCVDFVQITLEAHKVYTQSLHTKSTHKVCTQSLHTKSTHTQISLEDICRLCVDFGISAQNRLCVDFVDFVQIFL